MLETGLAVEEEIVLEEMCMADAGASIEMPARKMQDMPPLSRTQAEVVRSPLQKAFDHSQRLEINYLLSTLGALRP